MQQVSSSTTHASHHFCYGMWDFKPLSELKHQVEYLVDGLIEEHSPFVLCAQLKTMKTRVLVDLAVSLASGGKFLSIYQCRKRKVLFACAEDGEPVIRRNCMFVAHSRGMQLDEAKDLHVMARGGHINESSLHDLRNCLKACGPGTVLIVDPAKDYFGGLEPTSSILSHYLGQLRDICRECETTLILSCHSTKGAEGLDLHMMQGTAFASAAGGWWLMRRRGSYKFDGVHNLEVKYGGRTGCAGSLCFTIDEKLKLEVPTGYEVKMSMAPSNSQESSEILEAAIVAVLIECSPQSCNSIKAKLRERQINVGQDKVAASLSDLARNRIINVTEAVHGGKPSPRYSIPSSLSA